MLLLTQLLCCVCALGLECEIDIHKTVEEARACRSGMVQTEEQYKFIYDVIKYYIDTQKARIVAQVFSCHIYSCLRVPVKQLLTLQMS